MELLLIVTSAIAPVGPDFTILTSKITAPSSCGPAIADSGLELEIATLVSSVPSV